MQEYINLIWDWFQYQYGNNDFLIGTTVPFVLGAIVYALRGFVMRVWGLIVRNFTVSVRINSTMAYYEELNQYIYDNYVWGLFRRNFVLAYIFGDRSRLAMTSGYGASLALVNGHPGFVERQTEDSDSYNFKEHVTIRVACFRPGKFAKNLYEELQARVADERDEKRVRIFKSVLGERHEVAVKPKRPLSTVFLPEDAKDRIMGHLRRFTASEDYCIAKGIPWHTGVILHGEPGTGKTSLIHAIASELGRDIHYHTSGPMDGMDFDPTKTILVLEDIDAAGVGKFTYTRTEETPKTGKTKTKEKENSSSSESNYYSMADILNYLDGFLTPHGLIVIATTNHIDRLDAAIIRPGRFDLCEKIDKMGWPEYQQMCEFYGVDPVPESEFTPQAGATLLVDMKGKWQ